MASNNSHKATARWNRCQANAGCAARSGSVASRPISSTVKLAATNGAFPSTPRYASHDPTKVSTKKVGTIAPGMSTANMPAASPRTGASQGVRAAITPTMQPSPNTAPARDRNW
jgi:hypothetical protein